MLKIGAFKNANASAICFYPTTAKPEKVIVIYDIVNIHAGVKLTDFIHHIRRQSYYASW